MLSTLPQAISSMSSATSMFFSTLPDIRLDEAGEPLLGQFASCASA